MKGYLGKHNLLAAQGGSYQHCEHQTTQPGFHNKGVNHYHKCEPTASVLLREQSSHCLRKKIRMRLNPDFGACSRLRSLWMIQTNLQTTPKISPHTGLGRLRLSNLLAVRSLRTRRFCCRLMLSLWILFSSRRVRWAACQRYPAFTRMTGNLHTNISQEARGVLSEWNAVENNLFVYDRQASGWLGLFTILTGWPTIWLVSIHYTHRSVHEYSSQASWFFLWVMLEWLSDLGATMLRVRVQTASLSETVEMSSG